MILTALDAAGQPEAGVLGRRRTLLSTATSLLAGLRPSIDGQPVSLILNRFDVKEP